MPLHALTEYLGLFVGIRLYYRMRGPFKALSTYDYWYLLGGLMGALIGSRLLAALEDPYLAVHPPSFLYYVASQTIIGAIAGSILGVELVKAFWKVRERTGDAVAIPMMIAIMIGRIGCEAAGVPDGTIGSICHYAWCFAQGDPYPRHPLPLYEIAALALALPILYSWYRRRALAPGFVFRAFIVYYFSLRFFLEFIKDTHPLLFGITSIQYVCAAFVLWYSYDIVAHRLYHRAQTEEGS